MSAQLGQQEPFDQADALEAGFQQAAQNGIISQAYSVDPSTGFVLRSLITLQSSGMI